MDTDPLPGIFNGTIDMMASALPVCAIDGGVAFGASQIVALSCAVIALLLSAFVSGSEMAFFSITPQQIADLDDSPRSSAIKRLLDIPDRLLATILIVNNLVNVTIVVLMSYALSGIFDQLAPWANFLLQTVILTFLILLFGEIIPKLTANTRPLVWARGAVGMLSVMVKLFHPVSAVLARSTKIVNRVVSRQSRAITADELEQALEIANVQTPTDKEMLEGILKFGDTTASEIMTPRVDVTGLDAEWDFERVMEVVVDSGYSRLPVFGDSQDDIRGVLYARDLLPYVNSVPEQFDWRELIRKPYFVPESRMIDDLMEDFRKLKIHMAIVVDEFGGTQGLVTLEDVLEEIVGDIDDEYDEEEKTYKRLADSTFIFDGKTFLTDFFRITDLDPNDYEAVASDCETLAGMLLAIKGDFPKDKEPLVYGRCRFLVLKVDNHRISSVRVKVMPENQD